MAEFKGRISRESFFKKMIVSNLLIQLIILIIGLVHYKVNINNMFDLSKLYIDYDHNYNGGNIVLFREIAVGNEFRITTYLFYISLILNLYFIHERLKDFELNLLHFVLAAFTIYYFPLFLIVMLIMFVLLFLIKGDKGKNKYGNDPYNKYNEIAKNTLKEKALSIFKINKK